MYAAMYTHMYQHNIHREVKYYIVGVVFRVAKQFILSYNNRNIYNRPDGVMV